jgi:hypothetical protein
VGAQGVSLVGWAGPDLEQVDALPLAGRIRVHVPDVEQSEAFGARVRVHCARNFRTVHALKAEHLESRLMPQITSIRS